MKAVIVGCGRVGALLAATLDASGNDVSIIDLSTTAFDRLPSDFRGDAIRGNGTDEAVLRRAGAQDGEPGGAFRGHGERLSLGCLAAVWD